MRHILLSSLMMLLLSFGAATASAQDVAAAGRAFQTAQRAELGEDWARAAEFYELADSIAPSPQALRSALRMRQKAEQDALAAGHAEALIMRYPDDASSTELANTTLDALRSKLGRVTLDCGEEPCRVVVDEVAVTTTRATEHAFFVTPGAHQVAAEYENGTTDPKPVKLVKGGKTTLRFESPPPPPSPMLLQDQQGIAPGWFIASAVLTVGFGVAAIVSGLKVRSLRSDYNENAPNAREIYDSGIAAQTRTNIFIVGTAAFGIATLVLAFLTDWDGSPEEEADEKVSIRPYAGPDGFGLQLGGSL